MEKKIIINKILCVVCLSVVLLSCLIIPCSAVSIDYGDAIPDAVHSPWNMPSQITIPIYGVEDAVAWLSLDIPFTATENRTQWLEEIDIGHGYGDEDDYLEIAYYNSYNANYQTLRSDFVEYQLQYDNSSLPYRLSYNRFNYTPFDKYFLPGFDQTNSFQLFFSEDDRLFEVEYDIGFLPVTEDGVGEYRDEVRSYEVGSNFIVVDLYSFFRDIGILDISAYVEYLEINIRIDDYNVFLTHYIAQYEPQLLQAPLYGIKYQQVVNSGSASSFVEFLEDTVGGFLGTNLFVFGNVNITIGAILSVFAGISILVWLLKLFLGG